MRTRTILIAVLAIALLATCGLSLVIVYGTVDVIRDQVRAGSGEVRLFRRADASAEVRETRRFAVGEPARLEIDTEAGDIAVAAVEGATGFEVAMVRRAWAADEAAALAAARALTVTVEQQESTVKLRHRAPEEIVVLGVRGGTDAVSFVVTVPLRTAVDLASASGDVSLRGTTGEEAGLSSSFGDVTAEDLAVPRLDLTSQSGDVRAARVRCDGEVSLETSFGDVAAEAVSGRTVKLDTQSGEVKGSGIGLGEIRAESVTARSDFGDVELQDVAAGRLSVETQSGGVAVTTARISDTLEAETAFGELVLRGVEAAAIRARSSSGSLRLQAVRGALRLRTDFGRIEVEEAVRAALDVETSNGAVRFSGTLDPTADHAVHTDFGDVTLIIPRDSSFQIDLGTSNGRIRSELPVTLSGDLEDNQWRGRLNRGGQQLTVSTRSGGIEIRALAGR